MTSILFPSEAPTAFLYKLPSKISAISYTYKPDSLFLHAHMKDGSGKLNKRINISQCIFQHVLSHSSHEKRFKQLLPIKFWLRGTKVDKNGEIYLTNIAHNFSNVSGSDNSICWGGNPSNYNSMKGLVESFFGSSFNNDHCKLEQSRENIKAIRELSKDGSYSKSEMKLISTDADALYMIHSEDNFQAFVRLSMAGFNSLPENSSIMLIPLKQTTIVRDDLSYMGYVTPADPFGRKWFILYDGRLIGQMDTP
jgi:hypothetical protein